MTRWFAASIVVAALGCGREKAPSAPGAANLDGVVQVAVEFSGGHELGGDDYGRPCVLMAAALGVTPAQFREAFSGVRPARGRGPTGEEQRKNKEALMRILGPLGVTNERMDEAANYYRFRPQEGELWPTAPAAAYAEVKEGQVVRVVVTDGGAGYCTPPRVTVPGFAGVTFKATLTFSKKLEKNGGIEAVEIVAMESDAARP